MEYETGPQHTQKSESDPDSDGLWHSQELKEFRRFVRQTNRTQVDPVRNTHDNNLTKLRAIRARLRLNEGGTANRTVVTGSDRPEHATIEVAGNRTTGAEEISIKSSPRSELKKTDFGPALPIQLREKFSNPELIGQGGQAYVYRANWISKNGLQVAIKVPKVLNNPEAGPDFIEEVSTWKMLGGHQYAVDLLEASPGPPPHIVMEFCPISLESYLGLRGMPLEPKLSAHITAQVAEAVAFAHEERDIVHGDINVLNVMMTGAEPPRPKLTDWGVARRRSVFRTKATFTPAYATPEHLRGWTAGKATDVYQLGLLLYQLITFRLPFDNMKYGDPEFERHVLEQMPPHPSTIYDIPAEIDAVVMSCLAKDTSDRPTASKLVRLLNSSIT